MQKITGGLIYKEIKAFSEKFNSLDTDTEWVFCNGKRLRFVEYEKEGGITTPLRIGTISGEIQISKELCKNLTAIEISILLLWATCYINGKYTGIDVLITRDLFVVRNCWRIEVDLQTALNFIIRHT